MTDCHQSDFYAHQWCRCSWIETGILHCLVWIAVIHWRTPVAFRCQILRHKVVFIWFCRCDAVTEIIWNYIQYSIIILHYIHLVLSVHHLSLFLVAFLPIAFCSVCSYGGKRAGRCKLSQYRLRTWWLWLDSAAWKRSWKISLGWVSGCSWWCWGWYCCCCCCSHSCPIRHAVTSATPFVVHPLVPSTVSACHQKCPVRIALVLAHPDPETSVPMFVGLPHISDVTDELWHLIKWLCQK